jgi:hypothetical protein
MLDQAVRRPLFCQADQGDDGHPPELPDRYLRFGDIDEPFQIAQPLGRLGFRARGELGVILPGEVEVGQHAEHPDGLGTVRRSARVLANEPGGVACAGQ